MRESDVEKALVKAVKVAGGEIRKVKWIGRKSAPDRRVMLRRPVWVELKAPDKYPTKAQQREHVRMRSHGEVVVVIASINGVVRFMSDATGGWQLNWRYE